ncbi:MAG: RDD family protein [Candidatus Thiodiazotropha sp.]
MEVEIEYPRLLRRVQAVLIDSVIFILVIFLWWAILPFLENHSAVIKLAFPLIAWTTLDPVLVATTGGTPGHHLRGIAVQTANTGHRLGIVRSLIRALIKLVTSWWTFIFVLTSKRHQALHDLAVSSVVILREPETLPASERMAERAHDSADYDYPSGIRRIIIIFLWIVFLTAALILLKTVLLSNDCLGGGACTTLDHAVVYLIDVIWFLALGATVVYGWRCKLPGARKRKSAVQDLE